MNRIVSERGANIRAQVLATDPNIGYLVMDLEQDVSQRRAARRSRRSTTNIKTRILY